MKILFIPHRFPYPPDKGDRIRSYHLLRYLASLGTVDVATLSDEPVADRAMKKLTDLCGRVEVIPLGPERWARGAVSWLQGKTITEGLFWSPRLADTLKKWSADVRYAAAVVICSSTVPYLAALAHRPQKTVVDLIDVDSQKWVQYAEKASGVRRMVFRSEAARLRTLERHLSNHVDAVTLVSQAEADLYRGIGLPELHVTHRRTETELQDASMQAMNSQATATVHAIPNGVDLEYFSPAENDDAQRDPNTLVFVGALDYQANIDGLEWFCRHVWPGVRQRQPGAIFRIVGRRPTNAVGSLGRLDGIELVGEVADVRPFVLRSQVVIAPLRIARGIQNKVLEALAMAKAVVATPEALTGIDLTPGTHAIAADTPDKWIEEIGDLWDDGVKRDRLGCTGRQFVEQHHSWTACLSPFAGLLGVSVAAPDGHCTAIL